MSKSGKNIQTARNNVESGKRYSLEEALNILLQSAFAKFDETIDIAINLGVDPRKADQNIRGSVVLPHGTGKSVKVLAFAKGEKIKEAEEAGADFVGGDDLVEKIQSGWLEFDKVVATPDMMGSVGKIGRILGPRGLMPNAKTGTVTFEVSKAISDIKAGKVDFRVDKAGILHAPIGKKSFGIDKLKDNFSAVADIVLRLKPSTSKGAYVKSLALSSTMGPGVKLDTADFKGAAA